MNASPAPRRPASAVVSRTPLPKVKKNVWVVVVVVVVVGVVVVVVRSCSRWLWW